MIALEQGLMRLVSGGFLKLCFQGRLSDNRRGGGGKSELRVWARVEEVRWREQRQNGGTACVGQEVQDVEVRTIFTVGPLCRGFRSL